MGLSHCIIVDSNIIRIIHAIGQNGLQAMAFYTQWYTLGFLSCYGTINGTYNYSKTGANTIKHIVHAQF